MKNRPGDPMTTPARENRAVWGPRVIARDRVICEAVEAPRSGLPIPKSSRWLGNALRTTVAVLMEIFDEAAYERFLARTHAARSVASYRDFLRDREAGAVRRPRCC